MIHAQTVQHIEMPFAPNDRAMLDARFFAVAKLFVVNRSESFILQCGLTIIIKPINSV